MHRTASVNEYSTRYSEAIDSCATTSADAWRLQATDNKQGSSGFLTDWPEDAELMLPKYLKHEFREQLKAGTPGEFLSEREEALHRIAREIYDQRLAMGVAKEQARKDLPLSNYTQAYWKCDLKNILNFLSLRMDSHAQLEIRQFSQAMYDIIKVICPIAVQAFDDYDVRRGGMMLTATEIEFINAYVRYGNDFREASTMFFIHELGEERFKQAMENTDQRLLEEGTADRASNAFGTGAFDAACKEVGWPTDGKHRERDEMREKLKRMKLAPEKP